MKGSNSTVPIASTGFSTPLDAVLSGEYELVAPLPSLPSSFRACDKLPPYDWSRAFIRGKLFCDSDGKFHLPLNVAVTFAEAEQIRSHQCVVKGLQGSLSHWHTRSFMRPKPAKCKPQSRKRGVKE